MLNGQGQERDFRQDKRHITGFKRNSRRLNFTVWWGVARDYIFNQMNDIALLGKQATGTKEGRLEKVTQEARRCISLRKR